MTHMKLLIRTPHLNFTFVYYIKLKYVKLQQILFLENMLRGIARRF